MLDPLLTWIAAALVATLFAHAAFAKFSDPPLLEQHLAAYGVPDAVLTPTSRALPAVEALAAVLLLTPLRAAGAALAVTLLLLYAGAMAWHLVRGHELDCGCGGEPLAVSWLLVGRNAVLSALAVVAAAPADARTMGIADFAVVAAAVLLGTLLYAAFEQMLRLRRPRPPLYGRT